NGPNKDSEVFSPTGLGTPRDMTLLLLILLVVFLFAILGGAGGPIWTNSRTVIRRRPPPRGIEEGYEKPVGVGRPGSGERVARCVGRKRDAPPRRRIGERIGEDIGEDIVER